MRVIIYALAFVSILCTQAQAQSNILRSLNGPDAASVIEIDITPGGEYFIRTAAQLYYHGAFDVRFNRTAEGQKISSVAIDSSGKIYGVIGSSIGTYAGNKFDQTNSLRPFTISTAPTITIVSDTVLTAFVGKALARYVAGVWLRDTLPSTVIKVQSKVDTLVAMTSGGIYYRTLDQQSWTRIETDFESGITSMEVSPLGVIIGTQTDGIWMTDRIGGLAHSISQHLDDWQIVDVLYADGRIITAHPNNVYTSSDLGASWVVGQERIKTTRVSTLAAYSGGWYAGTSSLGLFYSDDKGNTWQALNKGLVESSVTSVIEYQGKIWTGSMLAGVHNYSPTTDEWTDQNRGLRSNGTITAFIVDADTLFALEERGGLYKWINDSLKWRLMPLTFSISSFYTDMELIDDHTAIVLTENAQTIDLTTGKFTARKFGNFQLNDIELHDGRIYIASDSGVFLSQDKGANWTKIYDGNTNHIEALGSDLYVELAGDQQRIARSTDGGDTWETLPTKLDHLRDLGGKLYAVNSFALVTSSDKGETWDRVTNDNIGKLYTIYRTKDDRVLLGVVKLGLLELLQSAGVRGSELASKIEISASPNPIASKCVLVFDLPSASLIDVSIFNSAGQQVAIIASSKHMQAGENRIEWNAQDLPNGAYTVSLRVDGAIATHKLIIQR